jgi:hypothetical protein
MALSRMPRSYDALSLRFSLQQRFSHLKDMIGAGRDIRPMRYAHSRHHQPTQIGVDFALLLNIQVTGAFIQAASYSITLSARATSNGGSARTSGGQDADPRRGAAHRGAALSCRCCCGGDQQRRRIVQPPFLVS